MATQSRTKARRPGKRKAAAPKGRGHAALERLEQSLDTAQTALADLRKDLSRGGRDVLKDVQKRVGDARKETRRLNKTLRADLEQLGEALTRRGTSRKRTASSARKSTAKRSTAKKKATKKKSAAERPTRKKASAKSR